MVVSNLDEMKLLSRTGRGKGIVFSSALRTDLTVWPSV